MADVRFESIRDSSNTLNTSGTILLDTDFVYLLESKFSRSPCSDQSPGRVIRVWRQVDFLGPDISDLQWQFEVLRAFVHASAAFVCAAPVSGVADEVVHYLCWMCEDGLGCDAEFTHNCC